MTATFKACAGLMLVGFVVACTSSQTLGQDDAKPAPLPKEVTWKLKALDEAPIRVVSTHYDPKRNAVLWVIELVRDFSVFEDGAYWGPAFRHDKRPRFRFELQDPSGIVLKTVDARYIGEYVNKAGKRFGALLEFPTEFVPLIKTVEAVAK